jgi:hypothetical protein
MCALLFFFLGPPSSSPTPSSSLSLSDMTFRGYVSFDLSKSCYVLILSGDLFTLRRYG